MISEGAVMHLATAEGKIFICLICYIGESYEYIYCRMNVIFQIYFLPAALTEKSDKNCDKGELHKMIARKYKACMKDMGGRATGKAKGGGGLDNGDNFFRSRYSI